MRRTPRESALRWAEGAYWKELAERTLENLGKDIEVARVTLVAYSGDAVPSKVFVLGVPASKGNEYFFPTCHIGNSRDIDRFIDWVVSLAEKLPDKGTASEDSDTRVGECVPS